jgi:hypothetical protein
MIGVLVQLLRLACMYANVAMHNSCWQAHCAQSAMVQRGNLDMRICGVAIVKALAIQIQMM